MGRSEFLAKPAAFLEVADQGLGEKGFGSPVGRPLELLVALRHVFDQVFHPEQGVLPIPHGPVSLKRSMVLVAGRPPLLFDLRPGSIQGGASGFKAKSVPARDCRGCRVPEGPSPSKLEKKFADLLPTDVMTGSGKIYKSPSADRVRVSFAWHSL